MRPVIFKTVVSSGTYSVVRRHYQPSSTWSGPVEITPAYRDVESVAVCVNGVSVFIVLRNTEKYNAERNERAGEARRKGGREAADESPESLAPERSERRTERELVEG